MTSRMNDFEKKNLMALIERELPYDLGEDTEVFDDHVFLELYGKAYGRGRESFSKFSISGGKVSLEEIDGDDITTLAKRIYDHILKFYPKIKTFTIMIQED